MTTTTDTLPEVRFTKIGGAWYVKIAEDRGEGFVKVKGRFGDEVIFVRPVLIQGQRVGEISRDVRRCPFCGEPAMRVRGTRYYNCACGRTFGG